MEKPAPKKQLVITETLIPAHKIYLVCVPDLVAEIENSEFCYSLTYLEHIKRYALDVNPLYDVEEVVIYLESLG